jgi:hypothetical protein
MVIGVVFLLVFGWGADSPGQSDLRQAPGMPYLGYEADKDLDLTPLPGYSTNNLDMIERLHARVSRDLQRSVDRLDDFFGDEQTDMESTETRARVRLGLTFSEQGRVSSRTDFRIKWNLPNAERRLRLILNTMGESVSDEFERIQDITGLLDEGDDSAIEAGLRYTLRQTADLNSQFGMGLRVHGSDIRPFVRHRLRMTFVSEPWVTRFMQKVRWLDPVGIEETMRLTVDRAIGKTHLVRTETTLRWADDDDTWRLRQTLEGYAAIGSDTILALELGVTFREEPARQIEQTDFTIRYRCRTSRDWLLIEVRPRAEFPEDRDYRLTPSVLFLTEIILGDARAELRRW